MVNTARLRALLTGRVEWIDPEDGAVEVEWLSWKDRWSIFGVHSYSWGWVRKYGALECGCTRNPITRRRVLIRLNCAQHGKPYLFDDDPTYLDDVPPWARHDFEVQD